MKLSVLITMFMALSLALACAGALEEAIATPTPTQAPPTPAPTPVSPPPTAAPSAEAQATLKSFMLARIWREDEGVRGLLTDALRQSLETDVSVGQRLFQVSNPCWYRYEVLTFEQPTSNSAQARVRVYQHWWMGDKPDPPWSLEQEIDLVATAAGWRVDQLGTMGNRREEPNEPHGPTTSACNVARQRKE